MKRFIKCVLLLLLGAVLISCGDDGGTGGLDGSFKLKAIVKSVGERIEVEVIESEYAFGIYSVITSDGTKYFRDGNKKISRDDIKPGDTVEIYYGGQVMMSYPPQIVAAKIVKV